MKLRQYIWSISITLYAAFFLWYTDFSGKLSDKEIADYISKLREINADSEIISQIETFAREDTGRQFLMINNIDYNEAPPSIDGIQPGASAQELMGRYMEHMLPAMLARASHPVLLGQTIAPSMDVMGINGAESWDSGAVFRYRSRRTMLDIVTNPDFAGRHDFKLAALDKTIAYPIETQLYLGDLRLIFGLIMLVITLLIDNRFLKKSLAINGKI